MAPSARRPEWYSHALMEITSPAWFSMSPRYGFLDLKTIKITSSTVNGSSRSAGRGGALPTPRPFPRRERLMISSLSMLAYPRACLMVIHPDGEICTPALTAWWRHNFTRDFERVKRQSGRTAPE